MVDIALSQVDFQHLKACGFQAVVFDKDNTLTKPLSNAIHPSVEVQNIYTSFFIKKEHDDDDD